MSIAGRNVSEEEGVMNISRADDVKSFRIVVAANRTIK